LTTLSYSVALIFFFGGGMGEHEACRSPVGILGGHVSLILPQSPPLEDNNEVDDNVDDVD